MFESLDSLMVKLETRLRGRRHPDRVYLTPNEVQQLLDYTPVSRRSNGSRVHPVHGREDRYYVSRETAVLALERMRTVNHRRRGTIIDGDSYAAIFFLIASLFLASLSTTGYVVSEGMHSGFDVRPLLSLVFLGLSLFMWAKK